MLAGLSAQSALTHFGALANCKQKAATTGGRATGSRAAQPAAPSGSAAQPATPSGSPAQPASLPLHEVNQKSAQFGAGTGESVVAGSVMQAAFASTAASGAEQPASINAVPSSIARPMQFASGKQCLDAFTSCETGEDTGAAQPGSNARSLRVESGYEVSRGQRGHQAEPLRGRIRYCVFVVSVQ